MKIKNKIAQFIVLFSAIVMTFSCDSEETKTVKKLPTIEEIAKADTANFSILLAALNKTGLINTVKNPGSYTVFAPTNAAFSASTSANFPTGITQAAVDAIITVAPIPAIDAARTSELRRLLQNHIIGVGTFATDLPADGYFKTFSPYGTSTSATISNYVNKSNGVVINGGVANGGATVTTADINASNGVVHVVNGVIAIPTIVSHVKANPAFSKLLSVVTSTGGTFGDQSAVLTTLNGATAAASLTVFAPTNQSFTTVTGTGGFANGATAPQVTKLLQYHVWSGNRLRSAMTEGLVVTTATSPAQTFKFLIAPISGVTGLRIEDKGIAPNNISKLSTVPTFTDIQASNGAIHQVDKVLQPVL